MGSDSLRGSSFVNRDSYFRTPNAERRTRHRGLLLIEACVAAAVMTVAVVWMLRGFSQTMLLVERTRDELTALRLLQEQTIYAFAQGGAQAAAANGSTPDGAWTWTTTTTPAPDTTSSLLLTQFTLQWTQRGRPHTLTAATWLPPLE